MNEKQVKKFRLEDFISKAAADLIRDHNRIVIDSGSTTGALIQQLNTKRGLVVMTNSLHVANALNELESEPTIINDELVLGIPIRILSKAKSRSQKYFVRTILTIIPLELMVSTLIEERPRSMIELA